MFTYAPPEAGGSGFAIATGRFIGLLSSQWSPDLVSATFHLLDCADARLATALASIADSGTPGSFALAELSHGDPRSVSIAVRGDIVVDMGSATTSRFSWPERATWLVGEGHGVESLRLTLASAVPASSIERTSLPLARGVVLAVEASAILVENDREERPLVGHPDKAAEPLNLAAQAKALSWTLQLPDGNELDAAPQIIVGRQPWRTDPHETSTYYVVAPSPRKEISGKHVEFAIVDNELRARDLGSTNGTLVFANEKPPRLLHDGRAVRLDIGDTLDLGEGFRIVVGARL